MPKTPPKDTSWITDDQKLQLLRFGIVVLSSSMRRKRRHLEITCSRVHEPEETVWEVIGEERITVSQVEATPVVIDATSCNGYSEPEPGVLELYISTAPGHRIEQVLVAEGEDCVVVYAMACFPAEVRPREREDRPHRVRLREPLGRRYVHDGGGWGYISRRAIPASPAVVDAA